MIDSSKVYIQYIVTTFVWTLQQSSQLWMSIPPLSALQSQFSCALRSGYRRLWSLLPASVSLVCTVVAQVQNCLAVVPGGRSALQTLFLSVDTYFVSNSPNCTTELSSLWNLCVCQSQLTLIAKTMSIAGISSSCFWYRGFRCCFSHSMCDQPWTDRSGCVGRNSEEWAL